MKRSWLLLVFCLLFMVGPALLQAADTPTLANLEIALWPEFDRPEVLVIYRGLFDSDTTLPVPVEIRIPADVGQPTAVAYVDEEGERFNQQHTTRVEGDWLVVSFELATLGFQLEYYDPLPVDTTGRRQYAYTYKADYPITALDLEVQVPPTAQDFVLEPPASAVVPETDGLAYHLVEAGALAQGEERAWTFAYQKDDEELTVSAFLQPETPTPAVPPAAERQDNTAIWIFLVAFIALVGVGAGAFWLGQRTQPEQPAPSSSRRHKRRGSGKGSRAQSHQQTLPGRQEAFFCHKCGTSLRAGSDFCHECGAPVRRE